MPYSFSDHFPLIWKCFSSVQFSSNQFSLVRTRPDQSESSEEKRIGLAEEASAALWAASVSAWMLRCGQLDHNWIQLTFLGKKEKYKTCQINGKPPGNTPTHAPWQVKYGSVWSGHISCLFVSLQRGLFFFFQGIVSRFRRSSKMLICANCLQLKYGQIVTKPAADWCFVGKTKICFCKYFFF